MFHDLLHLSKKSKIPCIQNYSLLIHGRQKADLENSPTNVFSA